jgi:hypothetical protein
MKNFQHHIFLVLHEVQSNTFQLSIKYTVEYLPNYILQVNKALEAEKLCDIQSQQDKLNMNLTPYLRRYQMDKVSEVQRHQDKNALMGKGYIE